VPIGKLYYSTTAQLISGINYKFQHQGDHGWWGELILVDYKQVKDGSGYIIELEDGRRGSCALKKRVNRAVTSLPPRYVYHFTGSAPFK
jgi:hypothetical protein